VVGLEVVLFEEAVDSILDDDYVLADAQALPEVELLSRQI
jgi:hypothetical protein